MTQTLNTKQQTLKPFRVIVVDDEPLARRLIIASLAEYSEFEVIAECGNGRQAVDAVNELSPDLMFLDIQMPGMSGFELISKLQPEYSPAVVFATAYDSFAVDAFRVHALDYLLKPIDPNRLAESLQRVRQHMALSESSDLTHLGNKGKYMDALSRARESGGMPAAALTAHDYPVTDGRLAIRDGVEVKLVAHDDIDWVDAAGDYMCVHVSGDTHIMRCTMKELQERLSSGPFVRIHRSTIVNLRQVLSVKSLTKGESELTLGGGVRLKVSRSYKAEVDQLKRS